MKYRLIAGNGINRLISLSIQLQIIKRYNKVLLFSKSLLGQLARYYSNIIAFMQLHATIDIPQ